MHTHRDGILDDFELLRFPMSASSIFLINRLEMSLFFSARRRASNHQTVPTSFVSLIVLQTFRKQEFIFSFGRSLLTNGNIEVYGLQLVI